MLILKGNPLQVRENSFGEQWMQFKCPGCSHKNNWVFYGNKEDETFCEAEGFICNGCGQEVAFEHDYENLVCIFKEVHKTRVKTKKEAWVRDRIYFTEAESKAPVKKQDDKYDPRELEESQEQLRILAEKICAMEAVKTVRSNNFGNLRRFT